MSSLHKVLRQVEEYAAVIGVSPETVCRNASGNPRLYQRLKRRAVQTDTDVARLKKHMRDNPPRDERHILKGGDSVPPVQGGVAQ